MVSETGCPPKMGKQCLKDEEPRAEKN